MSLPNPARGEIWLANFDPTAGREQAGKRPALILSLDAFNRGPATLVIALPFTTVDKNLALHVRVTPPEGGLAAVSYIKCEDVRSMSKERFLRRWGRVDDATMNLVEDRIRILLAL